MKTLLTSLIFALFISLTVNAQMDTKVIAVVNRADWCPACEKNGERAMTTLMEHNKNKAVRFIVNDLTDKATKAESAKKLQMAGLEQVMSSFKATGMVYFFDAKTKKLIDKISVVKSNSELAKTLENAKK